MKPAMDCAALKTTDANGKPEKDLPTSLSDCAPSTSGGYCAPSTSGGYSANAVALFKLNSSLAPEEQLIQCRYNPSHLVVFKRMPHHYLRCSDAKGNEAVPIDDGWDDYFANLPVQGPPQAGNPRLASPSDVEWKMKLVPTYDPKAATEGRDVVRHIQHTTKSERRLAREVEDDCLNVIRAAMKPVMNEDDSDKEV